MRRVTVLPVVFVLAVACGGGSSAKKPKDGEEAGPPVRTVALLDRNPTPAGIPVGVTCQVQDAAGLAVEATTVVDPVDGLTIAAFQVSSTRAGTYAVSCSIVDFQGAYEKVPATLEVKPGDPASLEVTVDPDFKNYPMDEAVTVGWKVADAYGNEISGLPASITVDPPKGLDPVGGKLVFHEEGTYEVTVTLGAPHQGVSGSRTLLCDQTAPVIDILFPDRGETFDGDGRVVVKGKVTDATSKVQQVFVNDHEVTLDEDGLFEYPVASVHGLNVIVVKAVDEWNKAARTTRGWYYSTAWVPVKDETKVADVVVGEGAMMFLGQTALDDGVHDPAHIDDIATLVEVVLAGLDLDQLLGNQAIPPIELPGIINYALPIPNVQVGLAGDMTIEVGVHDVVMGSPKLGLKCRDGGVAASVSLEPVSVGLTLTISIATHLYATNPVDGKQYVIPLLAPAATTGSKLGLARIAMSVDIDVDKKPGQDLHVEGKDFQLALEGIAIDPITDLVFDLGEIDLFGQKIDLGSYNLSQFVGPVNDFLANYVLDPVLNFITQPLVDLLEPLVTNLIGDAIKQVLGMLVIEQTLEIPPLLGGEAIPIDLSVNLGSVVFTADGGRVGLNAGVLTKKGEALDRNPLGSILRAGCASQDPEPVMFEFAPAPEIQLGVRHDLVNEVLFMLWWSGMLHREIDLSGMLQGGSIPIEDLRVTLNLLLPPILDDCQDREQRIELADAWIEAKFSFLGDQHVGVWLNMKATGGITASGNQIGIKIAKVDTFEAEITDIAGNLGPLGGMIDGLVPMLIGQIEGQEFSFDVPSIPLDGIVPGIPPGTSITLGNLTSTTHSGVAVIGGDLQ